MPPAKLTRAMRDALAVYGYLLLGAQKTGKAHAVFKGMRVLFPNDPHVAKSLALTSLAAGEATKALALAEEERPGASDDDALALDIVRGKALFALGRPDEAQRVFERVLVRRAAASPIAPAVSTPSGGKRS